MENSLIAEILATRRDSRGSEAVGGIKSSINGKTFWRGNLKGSGLFNGPPSDIHPIDDPAFEAEMKRLYQSEMNRYGVDKIKLASFDNPNTQGFTHPYHKNVASRSIIYLKKGYVDATLIHEFSHAEDYFNGTYAANYLKYGEIYANYASEEKAYLASAEFHLKSGNRSYMFHDWGYAMEYRKALNEMYFQMYFQKLINR